MAKGMTRDFDRQIERMLVGPRILMLAPESNIGKIFANLDGEQIVVVPGQSLTVNGHALVLTCEHSGDSINVTVDDASEQIFPQSMS